MEDQKNNQRIAIIGAGAAGLTAAEALREKGYTNVTIFERNDRVGGKCCTKEFDGRLYELGAGIIAENNRSVMKLVEKYDVSIQRVNFGKSILVNGDTGEVTSNRKVRENFKLASEVLLRYRKLFKKYKNIIDPGFVRLDSDLSMPFSTFAKKNNVESLASQLELFFTGYGYGYFCDVPAAYVLKYFNWDTIMSFAKRKIYTFPDGIQHLWSVVAKNNDVRLGSSITKIQRDERVMLTVNGEKIEFDKLIVTSPFDELLDLTEGSTKELELFGKIKFVDYRTVACSVEGLDKVSGYVPGNFSPNRAGHPVFWYFRHMESDIYMFYTLADWRQSDEEVVGKIEKLVNKMSGKLKNVQTVKRWKYFPHVSPVDMQDGYFDDIENLQGKNHTYYVGELMNFSTVGLTSEYAKDLIDRFF